MIQDTHAIRETHATPLPAVGAASLAEPARDATLPPVDRGVGMIRRGFVRPVRWVGAALEWLLGLISLVVGLAVLASLPVLQFLSLGYLLESSGRVARTGRLRDGLIGVRKAARIGSFVVGTWLVLFPLRILADQWRAAELISPGSSAARWLWGLLLVMTLLALLHLLGAWFRGGRLRHFVWPAPLRLVRAVRRGGWWSESRDRLWQFAGQLQLPHFFWLGTRGFVGGLAWLLLPTLLMIASTRVPQRPGLGIALGVSGGMLLAIVMMYLPFLQARFAAANRLAAMFQVGAVRRDFARAPLACWVALLITLASALPLYLLKIEATPREVVGLLSLVFVGLIFPARLTVGWALGRAGRRSEPRWFGIRWLAGLGRLPLVAVYAFIVFFSQYTSWYGAWSMLEQHAVLVPAPF